MSFVKKECTITADDKTCWLLQIFLNSYSSLMKVVGKSPKVVDQGLVDQVLLPMFMSNQLTLLVVVYISDFNIITFVECVWSVVLEERYNKMRLHCIIGRRRTLNLHIVFSSLPHECRRKRHYFQVSMVGPDFSPWTLCYSFFRVL